MTMIEITTAISNVKSRHDLDEIATMLRAQYAHLDRVRGTDFNVGQSVRFNAGRNKGTITGTISKMNGKTASVEVAGSRGYRVPFSMLTIDA